MNIKFTELKHLKKIICIFALSFFYIKSNSQAIIGNGVATTNGTAADPIERYYNYTHSQIVYTAAELTTAGMSAGCVINSLGFSVSESAVELFNFTIAMGHTAQPLANPYIALGGLTSVRTPYTYMPVVQAAGSFDMIPFTTNFIWDGTSNIVIDICTGSNPYLTPYGGLRYTTTAVTGGYRYVRTDGTNNCGTATGTNTVNRPNIRFNFTPGASCAGQPVAGTATSTVVNACGLPFTLNLTGNSVGIGMTFQWQSSPAGANTWTNLGAVLASPSYSTTQASATDYRCIVTCTNGNLSATSTVISVGQNPAANCYCIPVATATTYYLNNFSTTGGVTNISNLNTGIGITNIGYSNYTGIPPVSQIVGGSVNFSASGSTGNTFGWRIYVDWNQDGDFIDVDELLYQTAAYTNAISGTFVVPVGATPGVTRMRIYQDYLNSTGATGPCGPYAATSSETEDYSFQVLGNCVTANAGTVSPATTSLCTGSVATLSSNAVAYLGTTYQWKESNTPGGPYTNVVGGVGANTSIYTIPNNLAAGTHYFILQQTCANCGPCSALSNEVTVTVNATPAPTGTSSTQCVPGIPAASVSSNAGPGGTGQFTWYSAAVGGTVLQSPPYGSLVSYYFNNFTSPVLVNSAINGNASIASGVCQLTPNLTSQMGGLTINPSGVNSNKYSVDFDLTASPAGLADGISYNFAPDADAVAVSPAAEMGTGSKLRVCFDSYGAMPNAAGIYILYNMNLLTFYDYSPGVVAYSNNTAWVNTPNIHATVNIDSAGRLTLTVGGNIIFNNLQLPADFANSDKSAWKHVIKARSGGIAGAFGIDNLDIKHGLAQAGYTTYQTILNNTTDFYISEMGTSGCASPRTLVTATVGSPTITASPATSTVCQYGNVTLSGSGAGPGGTYVWSGGITDGVPFVANATTIYTVTGMAAGGCTNTATAMVIVNPALTGSASVTPSSVCLGGSAVFNGSVPTTCSGLNVSNFAGYYAPANWSNVNVNSNGTVNTAGAPANIIMTSGNNNSGNPGSTNYSKTIGCAGTVSFNWSYFNADAFGSLFDYPRYTINGGLPIDFTSFIAGGSNSQSSTETITVNAGDVLQIQLYTVDNDPTSASMTFTNFSAPEGPVGGTVSFWDAPAGGTNVGAPPVSVTPAAAGTLTYYAEYTANGTGCVNPVRDMVTLTINGNPVVTSSPVSQTVCENGMATISGGGAATYTWTGGITNATPFTVLAAATYTVTGTDANGCTGTATASVMANPLPAVTASPVTQTVCENGMATVSGGGAASYTWTGGIMDATPFMVIAPATYTVTGTDANGCTNTATAGVIMNAAPVVSASATPSMTCNMTSVTPNATGANSYVWTGGLANGTPFVAMATATYTVTGTNGAGCTATSSVTVTVNPASGALAPGTSNQSQTHDDDFNINYYDGACDLIATVDDGTGGNILGLTTSTVNVDATAGTHNGQPFVRRWYQITPTNNGSADVILYINQSDFDDYNAVVVAPYLSLPTSGNNADPNVANIRITKNDDAGLGNNPIVITPTVNWNGTYWELSFNTPSFSQFRVHSVNPGGVPLPATVTNFSGMKLESSDKLSWTTASEQNNAYFNLQHSTDGVNFSTIAKVNSKAPNGNSTSTLNYSSVNNKPALGHNYYRLQQVNIDQKVSVHAQIVDLIWGANGSSVSIYPNPTTDILNVDLYTAKAANTTVKLLDMSGRVVKQIQAKSVIGMNNIQLSMGEIAGGLYTIQVYENNTLTHTSKVRKND